MRQVQQRRVRFKRGGSVFGTARCVALVATLVTVLLSCAQASASAITARELGYSLTPSTTEPYAVCPSPEPGRAACALIAVPPGAARRSSPLGSLSAQGLDTAGPSYESGGESEGLAPKELREAYNIPETGGAGQTVAIVDAYNDSHANADLKVYREKYKLSPCTEENGCFKRVNQKGETGNYPKAEGEKEEKEEKSWDTEISLDTDMVSAICQECHILLVEANNNLLTEEYAAEDEAAEFKPTAISNSWYAPEYPEETSDDKYFNHGIPITVASGDKGYRFGPSYPAASPYVISVGGTELKKVEKTAQNPRGWEESVWKNSGGGCSLYESKPIWQTDLGCSKRTENDVAAVAGGEAPVSMYDEGWKLVDGTSIATPIVAAIEGHASKAVREEGAEAFYKHKLFDVTLGSNSGACNPAYLCTAEEGYDGPTGWGTPDGPLELAAGFHAITQPAMGLESGGATLNGYVDPEGSETTYHFEYGPTTSYGTSVPVPNGSVGSGVVWKAVSQRVTGLLGTYHYRLVAKNSAGTTIDGEDHTFTPSLWSSQSTPLSAESYGGGLRSVSCVSSTECVAVGGQDVAEGSGYVDRPVAERLSGSEWSPQSPGSPGTGESSLESVSCTSSSACMAVGDESGRPFAERLVGSEWSAPVSLPIPSGVSSNGGVEVKGVSCASSTSCIVVGYYTSAENKKYQATEEKTLVESWNGAGWAVLSSANPAGETKSQLVGVSCGSSGVCTAVGNANAGTGTDTVTLAEHWSGVKGSEWSIQSTLNPTGATTSALDGVSCSSPTSCMAVGNVNSEGFTESLSGSEEWQLRSSGLPGPLYGVSCTSSSSCDAVGGTAEEAFGQHWNGVEWATDDPAIPGRTDEISMLGISCTSEITCTGVGHYRAEAPLAERLASPAWPTATTEKASGVTDNGATLNANVNPDGLETTYRFEYGATTSYGHSVPVPAESIGAGIKNINVAQTIGSLTPQTEYQFRVVGTNAAGTTYGANQAFVTPLIPEFISEGKALTAAVGVTGARGASKLAWTTSGGVKLDIKCTGGTNASTLEKGGASEVEVSITGCSHMYEVSEAGKETEIVGCETSNISFLVKGALSTNGSATQNELRGIDTTFTIPVNGKAGHCALSNTDNLEGNITCAMAESGPERVLHQVRCEPGASDLTVNHEAATLETGETLRLTGGSAGKQWSAHLPGAEFGDPSYTSEGKAAPFGFAGTRGATVIAGKVAGISIRVKCTGGSGSGTFEVGGASTGEASITGCSVSDVEGAKEEELTSCKVANFSLSDKGELGIYGYGSALGEEFASSSAGAFAELSITGSACAVKASKVKLEGAFECELHEAGVEKVEHKLACKPTEGEFLTFDGEAATIESSETLELTGTFAGKKWSAHAPGAEFGDPSYTSEGKAAPFGFAGTRGATVIAGKVAGISIRVKCTGGSGSGTFEVGGASTGEASITGCSVSDVEGAKEEELTSCKVANFSLSDKGELDVYGYGSALGEEFVPSSAGAFAELSITGSACAVKVSKGKLQGVFECELHEAGAEKVERELACRPPEGELLTFDGEAATIESSETLKLTGTFAGKKWRA
jgi:hypothetical protein